MELDNYGKLASTWEKNQAAGAGLKLNNPAMEHVEVRILRRVQIIIKMEALTVEEFKALLKMFFEAGEKRGQYGHVPPSYFEKVNFDRPLCFED